MFCFFCFSYYLYIELGQRPRQIYRYVDIQMPTDGADGADHNKK